MTLPHHAVSAVPPQELLLSPLCHTWSNPCLVLFSLMPKQERGLEVQAVLRAILACMVIASLPNVPF